MDAKVGSRLQQRPKVEFCNTGGQWAVEWESSGWSERVVSLEAGGGMLDLRGEVAWKSQLTSAAAAWSSGRVADRACRLRRPVSRARFTSELRLR